MKKTNDKERLFEVMGKVNKSFKPKLNEENVNEFFGLSKKEKTTKARNQEIEAAKQEVQEYNFRRLMFQPARGADQNEFNETKRVRINGVTQELPKLTALMPELFDTNQGAVNINSEYDIPTYIPLKWSMFILDNNKYIDNELAIQNFTQKLDTLNQMGETYGTPDPLGSHKAKQMNEMPNWGVNKANPAYTHFAVLKDTNKIVNGWEYRDYDQEELRGNKNEYFFDDIRDMQINPKIIKVVTGKYLLRNGIDPFDYKNWHKPDVDGKEIYTME